jgi:hypoxanthine phosphoribosyltransferase
MDDLGPRPAELLFSEADIAGRTDDLAAEISAYGCSPAPPLFVGVLNGSLPFLSDLVRRLPFDVELDFMAISSYARSGNQSGVVRIVKDLDADPTGRDVVIVEDIVDTGLTLNYLRRSLAERGPRSLAACVLLDKIARRIVPVAVEHRGFEVPDVFVVGYGLDFQGLYRNVRHIYGVKDVARLAGDPRLLVTDLYGSHRA